MIIFRRDPIPFVVLIPIVGGIVFSLTFEEGSVSRISRGTGNIEINTAIIFYMKNEETPLIG